MQWTDRDGRDLFVIAGHVGHVRVYRYDGRESDTDVDLGEAQMRHTFACFAAFYLFQAPHTFQMEIPDSAALCTYQQTPSVEQHKFGWQRERIDAVTVKMAGKTQKYYWLVYSIDNAQEAGRVQQECEGDK
jgi:hypothetical protein